MDLSDSDDEIFHFTTDKKGPCVARVDGEKYYISDGPGPQEIIGDEVKYVPYQMKGQRSAIYIVGASGSGKSTFIANCLKYMSKEKKIYLFSTATELDPVFDEDKVTLLQYKDKLEVIVNFDVETLQNTICIFDDFDATGSPAINKAIGMLLKTLLETGRKLGIDLFCVSHNPRDYMRTRTIILECPTFVVFPQTNRAATIRFVKEYYDDDKQFLATVRNIKDGGRFTYVTLHQNVPRYMSTNKRLVMLP